MVELFKAFGQRDEERFRVVASAIIANAKKNEHHRAAREMERALTSGIPNSLAPLQTLSSSGADSGAASLMERIEPTRSFDDLVLDPALLGQLKSVAAEQAHADTLMMHRVPPRRRLLFYGPPGCGKTSAAEALARALGWPLAIIRLDSIIESYLGQTASNLRTVFDAVRWDQQVVLFDEFDALGRSRDELYDAGEMKRVVSNLLMLIERFTGPGIMIAATNHEGLLDTALWRRFDDVAYFGRPDDEQIRDLLRRRLEGIHPDSELDISSAASDLQGRPHAAVEHAVWSAYREQIIAGESHITEEAMRASIQRTTARPW